jgi:hypothetical protein
LLLLLLLLLLWLLLYQAKLSQIEGFYCVYDLRFSTEVMSTIVRDITPVSPLKIEQSFGGTYRIHFKDRKVSEARHESESVALIATCFCSSFIFGLFFDTENGGCMILGNLDWLPTKYTVWYPWKQCSSVWCIFWRFKLEPSQWLTSFGFPVLPRKSSGKPAKLCIYCFLPYFLCK